MPERGRQSAYRIAAVVLAVPLLAAAPAAAATTIGGSIDGPSDTLEEATCTADCGSVTFAQVEHFDPPAAAPAAGVVVRWRVGGNGALRLKVVRPAGDAFAAVRAGPVQSVVGASPVSTLALRPGLPIDAGEAVGVDLAVGSSLMVREPPEGQGAAAAVWAPGLFVGATRVPDALGPVELLLEADVEPDSDGDGFGDESQDLCPTDATTQDACPAVSNAFSFDELKKNKRKGIAILTVEVPGPGELALARTKQLKPAAKQPLRAGKVRLKLRPRGKAKRKLSAKRLRGSGKAKLKAAVRAKVTYTPTGGEPLTKQKKLKLVRAGKRRS